MTTAEIIQFPRTQLGRIEIKCAAAMGRKLSGVDWDAEGQRMYAEWQRNNPPKRQNKSDGRLGA